VARKHPASPEAWPAHDSRDWQRVAEAAAEALAELWGAERHFWRDTQDKVQGRLSASAEVAFTSARATESLIGLADAYPHWQRGSSEVVGSCAKTVVGLAPPQLPRGTDDADLVARAALQVAALATALVRIALMGSEGIAATQRQAAAEAREEALNELRERVAPVVIASARQVAELESQVVGRGGSNSERGRSPALHPYVLFRLMRALWLTNVVLGVLSPATVHDSGTVANGSASGGGAADEPREPAAVTVSGVVETGEATKSILGIIRERTRVLVADHQLQHVNHHESVALLFCGAGLTISEPIEYRRFIEVALESALTAQRADGAWPLTRILDRHGRDLATITTFEVAAVLADSILLLLAEDPAVAERLMVRAVPALLAAARNADQTLLELDSPVRPRKGWCAELTYGDEAVETLATALALEQAVAMARLAAEARSHEVLRSFDAIDPSHDYWPDWLRWKTYRVESEPDSELCILRWFDEQIVQPRLDRVAPWGRRKAEIVLMFGPPGTTKTTIVRSVAEGLDWPLVSLSPGDFIREGLDMIEAQATKIFERLHDLTHAVVLFDECDELFLNRGQEERPGEEARRAEATAAVRGIGAFVTASMLPKLQDLHDRSQVLVFVLTNFFGRLDPAIRRLGRIDHMIGIGPPDETQRKKTLRAELLADDRFADVADDASTELASLTQRFNRPELIQAARLFRGELRRELAEGAGDREEKLKHAAAQVYAKMAERITMTEDDLETFVLLASTVSEPHADRRIA
jgi:hypothetical protein